MRLTRRRALATGAAALGAGLAGCLGSGGGSTGLTLESVEVGGSPGGEVPLRPSGVAVLLDFFATWCAPCKPEMKNLRAARERFGEDVHIVSITSETDVEAIRDFWTTYEGTWPVLVDRDLVATQSYSVGGVPTLIALTPGGEEVWRHVGLAGEGSIVNAIETARG